jgi:predicted ATPase
MREGLAAKCATGAEIKVPYYLGVLAGALCQAGQRQEALALLADALARVERTDTSRYWTRIPTSRPDRTATELSALFCWP